MRSMMMLAPLALVLAACATQVDQTATQATAEVQAPPTAPAPPPSEAQIVRLDPRLDAVLAADAVVERVATGFEFVEGPMWREGRLWFSDLVGDKVYAVTPQGEVEMLIEGAGGLVPFPAGSYLGSNAMVTDSDGSVLLAQHGARQIARLDAELRPQPFISDYQGRRINSPNDMVFGADGALWFTDPPFGLPRMNDDPGKQVPFNAVWRYADGQLTPAITDLTLPNGIAFSPDGGTLYVANYGSEMFVKAWNVGANGALSNGRVVISYTRADGQGGPDGLKVDSLGNLWTTGPGGIRIVTPDGVVLGQIRLPEVAANLAFAEDGRAVYITASHSIYRVRARVPGVMPRYRR